MIQYRKHLFKVLEHFGLVGEVAEIGVAEGNNSELMASWHCVTKLIMVDNWATIEGQKGDGSNPQHWHDDNYMRCVSIVSHNPKCKMITGLSVKAAEQIPDDSLVMVYIDADHSYEAVKADLNAWFPKVKTGGLIVGHDYKAVEYGVKQAVDEFCSGRFEVNIIPEDQDCDASFWFRKT